MACQTLNSLPAGVTAYLVAGSTTTMLAEGLPEGARLEFAAVADGPVLLSLEGVAGDAATAFEFTARQVDDLIARTARYVRIVTGDGDTLHVLAAGRVWERSGWSGECGRTQVVTRLVAGPPGSVGPSAYQVAVANGFAGSESEWLASLAGGPGSEGRGVESITDDDEDGIATVLYTDGVTGALPLPRGLQGDPAPMPEIAWAGDVLTVDGVSSPPLSGPAGPAPATSWSGTSLIVGDNPPVDLQGPEGERGPVGSPGAVATASDFLLVGPGRPDTPATTGGIITGSEPVGAEYRSTDGAGVGAWAWRKRPTGWVVTDGDTGLRAVPGATTQIPTVYVRRITHLANIRFPRAQYSNELTDGVPILDSLASWFAPSPASHGAPLVAAVKAANAVSLISGASGNIALRGAVFPAWLSADAWFTPRDSGWPTSLPGGPA